MHFVRKLKMVQTFSRLYYIYWTFLNKVTHELGKDTLKFLKLPNPGEFFICIKMKSNDSFLATEANRQKNSCNSTLSGMAVNKYTNK